MYFLWIILYSFIYMASEKVSLMLNVPHMVTAISMLLYWTVLFLFLYKKGQLETYGICLPRHKRMAEYATYIPLLLMPAINLAMLGRRLYFFGAGMSFEPGFVVWDFLLLLSCSFGEELLFRGFLLSMFIKQYKLGAFKSIVATSVIFSFLHVVNLCSGITLRYALVQGVCAAAVGFCFAVITFYRHSIIPSAVVHALINITSFSGYSRNTVSLGEGKTDLSDYQVVIYVISAVAYLVYGLWLYQRERLKIKGEKV